VVERAGGVRVEGRGELGGEVVAFLDWVCRASAPQPRVDEVRERGRTADEGREGGRELVAGCEGVGPVGGEGECCPGECGCSQDGGRVHAVLVRASRARDRAKHDDDAGPRRPRPPPCSRSSRYAQNDCLKLEHDPLRLARPLCRARRHQGPSSPPRVPGSFHQLHPPHSPSLPTQDLPSPYYNESHHQLRRAARAWSVPALSLTPSSRPHLASIG